MKKIATSLIGINIVFYLVNCLLLWVGKNPHKPGFPIHATEIFFIGVSILAFKKAGVYRWFGSKVRQDDYSNVTMGYVMAALMTMGALLFNFVILMQK